MAALLQIASDIFLLAVKFICDPGVVKAEQNTTPIKHKIPQSEPENIRESILDFTAHFGEINPDILYLCRRSLSEPKRAVFAFPLPSVRRGGDEKNVKSSIFDKKQVNFRGFYLLSHKLLVINWNNILHQICKQQSDTFINALIVFVDQVHHNLRHYVLFLRAALGNHQRQGDQRIVVQKARTVSTVKNPIVFQEPKEQESGDTLVTVAERMVFNRQIEQISRLLLNARIEVPPAESLVNCTHRAFERLVLLVGEQLATTELVA